MVALTDKWTEFTNDNTQLIKLIRQLKPQSTSREIDNETADTRDGNRDREPK